MRVTELLKPGDCRIEESLSLAAWVFDEIEAPMYPPEGREHFMSFVNGKDIRDRIASGDFKVYICSEQCSIVGMMAIRDGSHISLAFVDDEHRGTGVGKELFDHIAADHPDTVFTVHAAPLAEGFYSRIGFVPTDMQRLEDGIMYIPMERIP
ncbi:MAG: GNAT family N-acetyltransferase [Oscillospiraceae bacterium]|nr:GNAT family N-acetyltransferase [Oscillospiraceae bacterium]MDY6209153.1 GNAT family N-acetyltransferase [Oscillospiraceae bacterium]